MRRFGKTIASTLKKAARGGSKRSHATSSSHYTKREESLINEDKEEEHIKELAPHGVEQANVAFLDLRDDREIQAYLCIKDREFELTPMYDPNILAMIGMNDKFFTIWKAVGWGDVDPLWERGSCLLTIQFFCTMQRLDKGIAFCLFGIDTTPQPLICN
jgi:hypothetical protein